MLSGRHSPRRLAAICACFMVYDTVIRAAFSRTWSMAFISAVLVLASNSLIKPTGLSKGGLVSSATFSIYPFSSIWLMILCTKAICFWFRDWSLIKAEKACMAASWSSLAILRTSKPKGVSPNSRV